MSIGGFSKRSLIAPAIVMDAAERSARNADYLVTLEDVRVWERRFGSEPNRSIATLYSGWQEKRDTPYTFLNLNSNGARHFPVFGMQAARFLIAECRIGGIEIDSHGVDSGQDQKFGVNGLILEKPGIVLENPTNLDQLPPTGTALAIGILRLAGRTGSPASVLALGP
jgi:kynurenine formamidase